MERLQGSPTERLVPLPGSAQVAFVPDPLPRQVQLSPALVYKLDEASRAVATLAGAGETIPNPHLLIRPFLRREAVLSSRIEGTQASLSDVFAYEAVGERTARGDVGEVVNYVRAQEEGIRLLERLPISLRLANELHRVLMTGVRGNDKRPGELRDGLVYIGEPGTPLEGARFVPPPADLVRDLLYDWEKFCNEDGTLPPLVACAMQHYQFETIHPYMDGNGRIGRLLIVLYLCSKGVLTTPLLYLSAYFESRRSQYYDLLFNVSARGDWQSWLLFFLEGVRQQSRDALLRVRRIRELQERLRQALQERKESANALRLLDELFATPYVTAPLAAEYLDVSQEGARRILQRLGAAGVLQEVPDSWPRLYVAREVMHLLEAPMLPQ